LLLTDLLHLLSCSPLAPVYRPAAAAGTPCAPLALAWAGQAGGLVEIGHGGGGFAFDNEAPRHRTWLRPYALANRLTTQGEWCDFIADGGYRDPRWWLAAGWDWVRAHHIAAPLYWRGDGTAPWQEFTLHGLAPIDPLAPVAHISLYEADAYARWSAAQARAPLRLPTEAEWEHAASSCAPAAIATGNFLESGALHPLPAVAPLPDALSQMHGDTWEWTASAYLAYPGFRAWEGAVGEYNAKFMIDQSVLRGGSCATPRAHIRASYRNFFPAQARWQFSGLRLAQDAP
jgi:ergothioneine biosynthesis protein EgtB